MNGQRAASPSPAKTPLVPAPSAARADDYSLHAICWSARGTTKAARCALRLESPMDDQPYQPRRLPCKCNAAIDPSDHPKSSDEILLTDEAANGVESPRSSNEA
eukprot:scaffold63519_cov20-Prasinocladus_malaysianus.AAC.2